jgi:hypothetical protein
MFRVLFAPGLRSTIRDLGEAKYGKWLFNTRTHTHTHTDNLFPSCVCAMPSFFLDRRFFQIRLFRSSNHILIVMHSETCREAGQNTQRCRSILQ